jgi:hypothetical protein
MAPHFVERAKREARRRPLAAIRHTQQFNILPSTQKIYNSSQGIGVSHRGSMASQAGLCTTQCFPMGIPSNTCRVCAARDCRDTLLQGLTTDCMEGAAGRLRMS